MRSFRFKLPAFAAHRLGLAVVLSLVATLASATPPRPAAAAPQAAATPAPAPNAGLGLGGALGQIGSTLSGSLGQIGGALGGSLGQISGALGGALNTFGDNLGIVFGELGGKYVDPTPGTVSSEGFIEHQGLARRYVLVRPETAVAGAPVLVLLHAHGLSAERMANLTRAGRLAADFGAWVYLPEAQGSSWNDDPASVFGADDVGFISDLIDQEVAANKLDGRRVYAAGYSNGGFMAERLACQLSSKIAGIATVAAEMRDSLAAVCTVTHPMPVAIFNGTSDLVVAYNGVPTLTSAPNTAKFWATQSGCRTDQTSVTLLPNIALHDGTTIALTRYSACPITSDVQLYTINGGGHTWPGSIYSGYTLALGITSFDIDATLELWKVLTPFALPPTP